MRDLDGETIAFSRLADTEPQLTEFFRILSSRPGRLVDRRQLLWTTLCRFRNSGRWNPFLWYLIYASNFRSFFFAKSYQGAEKRSYLGGLGALDPQYAEYLPGISAADKARYFEPIRLTDEHGELTEWLAPYAGKIEGRGRDAAAEATERRLTSIGDAD